MRAETEFNVRLCYVDFDGKLAMELLKKDSSKTLGDEFVQKAAPRVAEGIKRLKEFTQKYS